MTAFLHEQSKISFHTQKGYSNDQFMAPKNSKVSNKGKRYLLTSYNINDVTKRAPCDDNGNVMLMTQGAKQDFILHFTTELMLL